MLTEIYKVEISVKGVDVLYNPAGFIKKMIQLSVTDNAEQ